MLFKLKNFTVLHFRPSPLKKSWYSSKDGNIYTAKLKNIRIIIDYLPLLWWVYIGNLLLHGNIHQIYSNVFNWICKVWIIPTIVQIFCSNICLLGVNCEKNDQKMRTGQIIIEVLRAYFLFPMFLSILLIAGTVL